MAIALIVVDAELDASGTQVLSSPALAKAVNALMRVIKGETLSAIAAAPFPPPGFFKSDSAMADRLTSEQDLPSFEAKLVSTQVLASPQFERLLQEGVLRDAVICPLTLHVPPSLKFPQTEIYRACQDVDELRQRVKDEFDRPSGSGHYWLPLVHTAKGTLYGELIGPAESPHTVHEAQWHQPVHLSDRERQPLYQFGFQLLDLLKAPPATYLLQVGLENETIQFDRLIPFPDLPALASLGVQIPDLFTCHWRCLTHQPILDLTIIPSGTEIRVVGSGSG